MVANMHGLVFSRKYGTKMLEKPGFSNENFILVLAILTSCLSSF